MHIDPRRVEAKIQELELKTSGELVVARLPRAADYGKERLLWSLLLSQLAWELGSQFGSAPAWTVWPLTLALYLLLAWPPLLRLIVTKGTRQQMVQLRAHAAFLELGVCETRDRSGVLLVISEAERQVELIVDRGLASQFGPETWVQDLKQLTALLKKNQADLGLSEFIDRMGNRLAEHFPRRDDDTNELPDQLRQL